MLPDNNDVVDGLQRGKEKSGGDGRRLSNTERAGGGGNRERDVDSPNMNIKGH